MQNQQVATSIVKLKRKTYPSSTSHIIRPQQGHILMVLAVCKPHQKIKIFSQTDPKLYEEQVQSTLEYFQKFYHSSPN